METMTPTDKPKQPEKAKAAKDPNRRPVQLIIFNPGSAMDFPNGSQESNIRGSSEPMPVGKSYIVVYDYQAAAFEVQCCLGGKVTATRLIPREHIKQWEWA